MLTKESPLSFVRLAGKPCGNACSKMSIWPCLAASKNRPAKAIASGGSSSDDAGAPLGPVVGGAESIFRGE